MAPSALLPEQFHHGTIYPGRHRQGGFTADISFSQFWTLAHPRSGCWQIRCLTRVLLLVCRAALSPSSLHVMKGGVTSLVSFEGSPLVTSRPLPQSLHFQTHTGAFHFNGGTFFLGGGDGDIQSIASICHLNQGRNVFERRFLFPLCSLRLSGWDTAPADVSVGSGF